MSGSDLDPEVDDGPDLTISFFFPEKITAIAAWMSLDSGSVPFIQATLWKLIIFPEIRLCNASYSLSARPFL
jgi:hypothetical protein